MAKSKKKQPASAKQAHESESGGGGRLIQLAALAIGLALLVYLLVTNFADSPEATTSGGTSAAERAEGGALSSGEELPAAPVAVDPPFISFGEVPPNTMHTQTVTLRNTGSSPVRIIDTRPSCPCTTIQRQARTINPGRSITMDIEMDSEARLGPKNVNVNVMFDGYDRIRIPISATVVDGSA